MTAHSRTLAAVAFLSTDLTQSFGGVEFQVTVMGARDTSPIEVAWTDGPPLYAVDVVVRRAALHYGRNNGETPDHSFAALVSKRRTMSQEAEEEILSLLGSALGLEEFDMERIHPTPPFLAGANRRFTAGTVPEFMDDLFEKTSFCTQCPAPTSGGAVDCPCIIVRR